MNTWLRVLSLFFDNNANQEIRRLKLIALFIFSKSSNIPIPVLKPLFSPETIVLLNLI